MTFGSLIATPSDLTDTASSKCAIVMMTRIRLARNLASHRFPGRASPDERAEIRAACQQTINNLPLMQPAYDLAISDLTELQKQILVERHLISRELSASPDGAAAMISNDHTCSVMINEEDHLRIQFLRAGFQLKKTWAAINAFDTAIEDTLEYAFSPTLGYLTACPTNVGTGLRASAMMHLPALVIGGHMEKVVRAVNQLGIVVRGQFGEGSDASGSIFQISNQTTLGESEEQIIKRLSAVLSSIVEHELNARARLIENDSSKLFDKIGRAYGILQNAHLLTSSEAMNLLSLVRLGIDLGIFPDSGRPLVDRLFIESQPGHIQNNAGQAQIEPALRDTLRAAQTRAAFADFAPPNFIPAIEEPPSEPDAAPSQN
ncbi:MULTISPECIES: protein arginine kinase [Ereboglobus]|uniref:ATP--guanido phosphotransferase n=1 Tax=Ereboglobus luteus TaxID=1796921 RepID=A0A2U8E337_9BACT|nr:MULTISPECIES: protein arginine kinase [Ereboglobus]AWI09220.1 ATP--guanido phosphotransferase [Ereboglobus luteus]